MLLQEAQQYQSLSTTNPDDCPDLSPVPELDYDNEGVTEEDYLDNPHGYQDFSGNFHVSKIIVKLLLIMALFAHLQLLILVVFVHTVKQCEKGKLQNICITISIDAHCVQKQCLI